MASRAVKRRRAIDLAVAIAAAGVLVSCGGKQRDDELVDDQQPSGENDPDLIASQIRDSLIEMTTAAEGNIDDCRAMAGALLAVFDRVRPVFDKVETLRQDKERERALTASIKRYDQEAEVLTQRMSAALEHCRLDPAVGDAMAKMPVIQ
jgi:hypothetical protein